MNEREKLEQEIRNLTADLQSPISDIGDWKIIKCNEYRMKGEPCPYNIDELHAKREAVRARINEIQEQLKNIE